MNSDWLADQIADRAAGTGRFIVAIAGPPASGKSTLADDLSKRINMISGQPISAVVAMDGFHLDNSVLETRGLRHRKGAPETFDADGFVNLMRQIAADEARVNVPGFDRSLDSVVEAVQLVDESHRIVLVEGNYLLLKSKPWSEVHDLYNSSVFLDPGIEEITDRLVRRWLTHGHDAEAARQRALSNDIPNAKHVLENSVPADLTITS